MTNTPGLNPRQQAINTGIGADSNGILHEVSGLTEGLLPTGYPEYMGPTTVTVAVADKNNFDSRDGRNEVAVSWTDDQTGETHYKTINITNLNGAMPGFEDIAFRSDGQEGGGTYYLVDEGGGKTEKGYTAPTIYTAKLEYNAQTRALEMQVIGTQVAEIPEAEYSTPWGGNNSEGKANGAEGLAVDSAGNIYLGMQDSGNIYKATLENGQYKWGDAPVITTNQNDLSALSFDSAGNLFVGFGNSNASGEKNSVLMYSNSNGEWKMGTQRSVGSGIYDLEALCVSDGTLIAGSDNDSEALPNLYLASDNTTLGAG